MVSEPVYFLLHMGSLKHQWATAHLICGECYDDREGHFCLMVAVSWELLVSSPTQAKLHFALLLEMVIGGVHNEQEVLR
jgi:hypothetical protein